MRGKRCLKLSRRKIAERVVDPLANVERFDRVEDGEPRLFERCTPAKEDQLLLQVRPRALDHRVVATVISPHDGSAT